MQQHDLPKQCYALLLLFIFIASCNGQVKTSPKHSGPSDSLSEPKTLTGNQPKMIRTQGTVSGNVGCELQDKAGNLWFSTGGEGVYRYDGKSFTNFTTKDGLSNNNVTAIIEDKAGNVLVGTKNGICKYDGKSFTNLTLNVDLSKKPVWSLLEDREGDLWDLSKMSISSLLEDREGNLWFGTMNSGVYRYDGKTLSNFLNNDDHPFNLGNHYQLIMDILQDKNGNLWFSSWNGGGVWRYNGKSFTNYLPSADYYLSNEDGRSFANSKQESINNDLPIITNALPQDSISDDMIFSISEDKAGNLWFATRRHGACRYDGKSFTTFREHEGFVSRGVYAILEDKKGNMWLTTNDNGVWCYDGKSFKNFTTKDGLINDSVFSVLEDKAGNLWFGTRGFGLSRYDGKTFTSFSE